MIYDKVDVALGVVTITSEIQEFRTPERNHIFISYATEDRYLAEWLTYRLSIEGYKVWCDKVKLLGGESYPRDIDKAIKEQTFRFIALLSKNSVKKEHPEKERTIANNVAREYKVDFIIPVNVDKLKPLELDMITTNLTYIPFYDSWAEGLARILKLLRTINAPKGLNDGKQIVADTFLHDEAIKKQSETVFLNQFEITKVPTTIKEYVSNRDIKSKELYLIGKKTAIYKIDASKLLSFGPIEKPQDSDLQFALQQSYLWKECDQINGIPTINILKRLLSGSIHAKFLEKGLFEYTEEVETPDGKATKLKTVYLYFPRNMVPSNRISFLNYQNKKISLKISGKRKKTSIGGLPEYYIYNLYPKFAIKHNTFAEFVLQLNIGIHITNENLEVFTDRGFLARRKGLCKDWWNDDWLNRVLLISQFLADASGSIVIGNSPDEIVISSKPITRDSPYGIHEDQASIEADKKLREDLIVIGTEYDESQIEVEEVDSEEEGVTNG